MKPKTYIPLGRLISDVLIESGLVDHLIHHNVMEDVTVDIGRPMNAHNLKSMGVIEQVRVKPSLDTSGESLKDQRKIPNGLYLFSKIDPPEKIASSLPQTTPIYTQYEPQPSTTKPSDTPTPNPPSPSFQKFNLSTTTLPVSEVEMLNEPISPISSPPSSPSYYILSSDSEPSDHQSLTLDQLQARALATQQQPEPEDNTPPPEQPIPPPSEQPQTSPSEQPPNPPLEQPTTPPFDTPIIPPSENIIIPTSQTPTDTNQTPPTSSSPDIEPETTFPALEEAISLFIEFLMEKIRSLSVNSSISDDPSIVRIHWNRVIIWMTSEAFKLKGLSKQVHNDFIRDARERLRARLVREAEEKARREAEEKARLEEEQRVRESTKKDVVEVAATAIAAEAEEKEKADAKEAARIAAKEAEKASTDALTQGEQSNSGFAPMVLKTLEELQKEQHIV
ncbi:eukaryotic translation initiation factor 4 gamma-like [Lathyrus oleraceus]|uniref:eukaryotic translation initiation factor 4 gamma-like n=1 Tax=Pisum sativum TaxID=3888 RepID=UPI0021D0B847|nr:eukaryotic translation initiation factor 4 gamma-like [Pisum sativum]